MGLGLLFYICIIYFGCLLISIPIEKRIKTKIRVNIYLIALILSVIVIVISLLLLENINGPSIN